jgi:hypothetical protein
MRYSCRASVDWPAPRVRAEGRMDGGASRRISLREGTGIETDAIRPGEAPDRWRLRSLAPSSRTSASVVIVTPPR